MKYHKSILTPQMEIAVRVSISRGVSGRRTRRIQPSSVGSVPPLHPLPAVPYEVADWVHGRKVQANCHVSYARNWYSAPYAYIGAAVDLRIGATTLEIWHHGTRLCSHRLLDAAASNRYATNECDLPANSAFRQWDRRRCEQWADRVGPNRSRTVAAIFSSQRFDDQGVEPALAVLRLSQRYSVARLEHACPLALASIASPRHAHIRPILESGQDQAGTIADNDKPDGDDGAADGNDWVRGAGYYAGLGR